MTLSFRRQKSNLFHTMNFKVAAISIATPATKPKTCIWDRPGNETVAFTLLRFHWCEKNIAILLVKHK